MNMNAAERVADVDRASLEGQIREFVRKDNTPIHASTEACEWRSGQIPNTATGVGLGQDWRSLWISFR
jgi:hypothetical protein